MKKTSDMQKVDLLSFLKLRAQSFVHSISHKWNIKPSCPQALVFILQLAEWYIVNPDTPFVVSRTTFSDLRKLDDNTLKWMKALKMKNLNFSKLRCWYTDDKLMLVSCSGQYAFDQSRKSHFGSGRGRTEVAHIYVVVQLLQKRYDAQRVKALHGPSVQELQPASRRCSIRSIRAR